MLYVTTRSNLDSYTARRVLSEDRAPNGGFFVPFRAPAFSPEELAGLKELTFNGCVALVLNRLFDTKLTVYDVDFAIGRYSVRVTELSQRILAGECWHNLEWDFSRTVRNLYRHMCGGSRKNLPGDWFRIAARIAVLFGVFGQLQRCGIPYEGKKIDIACVAGDLTAPMAAWYAREWGLPVGNIVLCCNENGGLWDLFTYGRIRTDQIALATDLPEADIAIPAGLERFLYECGGREEAGRFLEVLRVGGVYFPGDATLKRMKQGMFVSVVSQRRIRATIPKVFGTSTYVLPPCGALAYAGLLDYRAGTGERRHSLVLAEQGPHRDLETVAAALDIAPEKLKAYLQHQ